MILVSDHNISRDRNMKGSDHIFTKQLRLKILLINFTRYETVRINADVSKL